jgi:hypothetical protein
LPARITKLPISWAPPSAAHGDGQRRRRPRSFSFLSALSTFSVPPAVLDRLALARAAGALARHGELRRLRQPGDGERS